MTRTISAVAIVLVLAGISLPGLDVATAQVAGPPRSLPFEPPPGGLVPHPGSGGIYREHNPANSVPIARQDRAAVPASAPPPRIQRNAAHPFRHKIDPNIE